MTSGWEADAGAMATAKTSTQGGAVAGAITVSKSVKLLRINEEGAIVGDRITAAKYDKDTELS